MVLPEFLKRLVLVWQGTRLLGVAGGGTTRQEYLETRWVAFLAVLG